MERYTRRSMYHLKKRDLSRYFIIIFFLAICLLVGKLSYSNLSIQNDSNKSNNNNPFNELKTADSWINEPRIIIDGNWSETKQTYDWCDGEGTWEEPYIIENVTINANNSEFCILINNSLTEPFIIRNCKFLNSSIDYGAIELINTNNGTILLNNISLNNGIGIRLSNSENNSITNNYIQNNTNAIILGEFCSNNTVFTNKITDNTVGINLTSSSCNGTLVYNNTFSNNGLSANDDGNNNKWDNGTLGNYWDDYTGADLNDDGIGDSPYGVSGTAGSQDNYPIWDDGENVSPELTIHLPYNNTYWSSAPLINVSAVDDNLEYIWYNVTGTPTIEFLEHNVAEVLNDILWDSLSEGEFQVSFFANDTNGNVNNSIILTLYKDTNSPTLLINSPSDGTYWNSRPNIQATATDTYFDSVWYEVGSFKVKLTNGVPELLNLTIWNGLPDEGSFTVYFFANDSAGNINNLHSRTLYKDIVVPSLTVNLPSDGTYWNTRPSIQATVTDTYFDSVWYEVASTKIILTNGIADLLNLTIWNSLADEGSFTINFFANDSAGNVNNLYSRTLYKDTIIPSLVVNLPSDDTYWNSRPNIQATATDTYFDSVWYEVGSSKVILTNGIAELLNLTIWNSLLDEGSFTIYFFANDSAGNVNNLYSLTLYKDIDTPSLVINQPSDATYWNSRPNIQVTATDTYFDSVWYEVSGTKIVLTNGIAELLNLSIWDSLGDEESFTINFFANDSAGNINNLYSRTLYKDIVNPSLVINLPSDGTYWNTRPNIQATASDTYFDSVWYEVGGRTIILTNGVAELLNLTIWSSLADEGSFTINFFANDSAGNINNLYSRTLYKDIVNPSLVVNLPSDGTYWNSRPNIQATATDTYFDSVWYEVSGTKIILTNGVAELLNLTIWSSLADEGSFTINFFANDSAGNINNLYSRTLYKDIVNPSLVINLPSDGTYWNSIPSIQATATDPYFDSIWYVVGSTTILLENGVSEQFDTTIWNSLSDEISFIVYFYANDSAGNINNVHNLTLFKDVVVPSLVINLPVNNTYWNSRPDIQATATDTYFDSIWYLVGSTEIMLMNGVSEGLNLGIWDSLPTEGLFNIYFYANDSAGNIFESLPLSLYRDILAPRVSIFLPVNNTYWDTIPSIKVSANDPNFNMLFYVVGGTQVQLTNNIEQLLEAAIWNSLPQGKFIIEIYANDTLGNLNNSFRITLFKDTIAPRITINSPMNNTYWNAPPSINLTVYDPNFTILYYMVGPTQIWLTNNTAQLLDLTIWNSLPQGLFQVRIYAWDSFGHLNDSLILELYKDTLAPEVVIQAPVNNTYWNTPPPLNITINDPNFDSLYYVVGTTHIGLTNNIEQLLDLTIWNGLPQGEFQIEIYANDSFGHLNNSYVITLYKDTVIPNLTVNLPLNGTYWKILPTINVTVLDTNFDSVWYKVGSTTIKLENGISEAFDLVIWNSLLEEDEFSIYFYANDSAGNMNSVVMYTLYKDIRNPIITINYPDPNDLFGPKSPGFDISISEGNLNSTWYTIVGSSTNFTFSGLTGTINQALWDEFGNGTLTLRFYANDTLNNLGFAEVTVRKNIYAPIINIVDPQSNDLYGIVAPDFMIYKDGVEINTTWYTIDNGLTNYTFSGLTGTINQTAWDLYGFGDIVLKFYLNDSLGVIGSDSVTIKKDPDVPEVNVTYINPLIDGSYCNSAPIFKVSVYDPNLQTIWYQVGASKVLIANNTEITLDSLIWDALPQGEFIIQIFANDTLGYLNDTFSLTFYKDTLAPRLVLNNPSNNTYYNTPPLINITVYDPNFNSLTYTVLGGYLPANIWLVNNTMELLNQDIWDDLPQGGFVIVFTAYDTFGHLNDTYILTLYKDTLAPLLVMTLPEDNSFHNTPPTLRVSSTDPNLYKIWYKVGTTTIELLNDSDQVFDLTLWNSLVEGAFVVEIYANDSFGHTSIPINITLIKDLTPPLITINSPINNTHYSSPPDIDITAFDVNLDTVWYTVMGTKIILTLTVEPLDLGIWNSLSEGEFQILIFANDSAGNLNNSLTLTLYKDTLEPLITINSPLNNSYYNSTPTLNIVAFDPNLLSISYKVLSYAPIVLINNTDMLFNSSIWMDLPQGWFNIQIIAEDSLGNINNSVILTLYKDTIVPEITINLPQANGLYGNLSPDFDIFVIESNINNMWYSLIGEPAIFIFSGTTGTIDQTTWDKFGNGTVTIRFFVDDIAGNLAYKDVVIRKNIFAPIITIYSPITDELIGINAPNFITYTSGTEIQETWYTLDNGLTNYTFTGLNGTINQIAWDNFGSGPITIRFYINDSLGKIGFDEVVVIKDSDTPIILINSPLNQTVFAASPFINLTILEPNLDRVWYSVNSTIIDMTGNLTQFLDSLIWDNLPQGTFIVELFANDTVGNLNNLLQLYLSKDTIGPNITVILPTENQRIDRDSPFFELSLFDENGIDISWYEINGSGSSIQFIGSIGRIDQVLWETIWDNLTQGDTITIRFYSSDTLGNVNHKDITVIKYTPKSQFRIFSDPWSFIIPTAGLIAMCPITIKLTKSRYYESLNAKEKSRLKKVIITIFFFLSLTAIFFIF